MSPILGAAFVLGLSAAGHCLLMCGPLVAAVQPRDWSRAVVMHLARITVYAGIGAVAGAAGGVVHNLGAGRWLAWMVAATLFLQALAAWRGMTGRGVVSRTAGRAVAALSCRLRVHTRWTPVAWGLINGLLPCGMVYSAATLAAGLASPAAGAATMAAFGAGTLPVLLLVATPASHALRTLSASRPWLVPVMLVVLAVLMGLRGLPGDGHAPSAHASQHAYDSTLHR